MIEKERIEELKRSIDLVALVKSKGIPLKKNGKSYKGLCPFHEDTNPSLLINPSTNLWQCFGCSAGGDVISFIEQYDRVDFKDAVAQLIADSPKLVAKTKKPCAVRLTPLAVKERKLLNRVIDFYHTAFCEDPRAKEYMTGRGIKDNEIFSFFKCLFNNLKKSLHSDSRLSFT